MPRFDRVYRLMVGKPGQKGLEIVPPIRLDFDVQKTASEDPNSCTVHLYNLSPATRRSLEEPELRCELYAGYTQENGPLLMARGSVVFGGVKYDGDDIKTELLIKDGFVEIRDTVISLGLGSGAQASAIIRQIAARMGLSLIMADDVPDRVWTQGFSFYGAARTALNKVVAGTGLEWSIQNQQLQLVQRGGTTRRRALVLAADSGLYGRPERTRRAAEEKGRAKDAPRPGTLTKTSAHQQSDGWKVTSLLLPTINPGDLVKLESQGIDAFFRVESLRHSGDSASGDWKSELQLVEPATRQGRAS